MLPGDEAAVSSTSGLKYDDFILVKIRTSFLLKHYHFSSQTTMENLEVRCTDNVLF